MGRRKRPDKKKKTKAMREKEVTKTPNWSNLHPDLLRCVFERLSFTSLNRAKLVCSSWYSASKGCVPSQNQIPWLIIFPSCKKNKRKKEKRCIFLVPEDNKICYRSRDLGVEFAQSDCLATCGSWLLLMQYVNLYILNPLTGERIDIPNTSFETYHIDNKACFRIDNKTKDYLVVMTGFKKFTKNGFNGWENLDCKSLENLDCQDVFYNDKTKKLYLHVIERCDNGFVDIWDFSGDMPSFDGSVSLPLFHYNHYDRLSRCCQDDGCQDDGCQDDEFYNSNMVVTVSGDFLMIRRNFYQTWYFSIFKRNEVDDRWEETDSLGDEALIYGLNTTVVANGSIPGIKRNSIYFNRRYSIDPKDIFVYDLTTRKVEPLPQCVLCSIPSLIRGRWFFPY